MIIKIKIILLILLSSFCYCSTPGTNNDKEHYNKPRLLKLDMFLSAFGVESGGFPTIDASIDFIADTSRCEVTYYEPWLTPKQYSFSKQQVDTIRLLLANPGLKKLKKGYSEGPTDQPTSTTTIYTTQDTLSIKDYGLQAGYPMTELYRIVYDLRRNFR